MLAARFAESRCVQCHHEAVAFDREVVPSRSRLDPAGLAPVVNETGQLNLDQPSQGPRRARPGGEPDWPAIAKAVSFTTGTSPDGVGEDKTARGSGPVSFTTGASPAGSAAKLLEGYQLVRQYGCFGCHEINGFDAAGRRVGPDLQLEARRRGRRQDKARFWPPAKDRARSDVCRSAHERRCAGRPDRRSAPFPAQRPHAAAVRPARSPLGRSEGPGSATRSGRDSRDHCGHFPSEQARVSADRLRGSRGRAAPRLGRARQAAFYAEWLLGLSHARRFPGHCGHTRARPVATWD